MSRAALLLAAMLTFGSLAAAVPFENPGVIGHVPDRIMVTLQPGIKLNVDKSLGLPLTGLPQLDALAIKHGVREIELLYGPMIASFKDADTRALLESVYTIDFSDKADLGGVLADYAKLDIVAEAHPVAICKMHSGAFLPNDLQSAQWHHRNMTLGGADIRTLGGWAETLGDSNIIVAIADSGIDWQHPDLGGAHPDKVNGALWTNWAEYYGTSGQDSDGNGYVDDIRGWDFVNVSTSQCWPGQDCLTPDNNPMDFEGHGTNCAGMVAPLTDNGIGIAGTAPGVKIMAIRVGWYNASGQGVVRMDFCSQGMVYAAANGAKIVSCSWGNTSFLASAVTTCLNAGMLIFESAGNNNDEVPSYLGSYNDPLRRVLSVAATSPNDTKSSFSSYGTWVDLSAPGEQIYTTHYNYVSEQSTYTTTQGTSFSSPLAAGAAALVWSSNLSLTPAQVSSILRDSCDNLDALNPAYAGKLGAGRINLLRALGDNVQEVPGEFLLLRDAVHSASVGDTIKVLASHPLQTVTLLGKSLQILGGYAEGYVVRDPLGTPTVISGNADNSAVQYSGAVDQTSVLDGFRLQDGGGRLFTNPFSGRYGGGMLLNGISPTLRNLVFTNNAVGSGSTLGLGGALALVNSQATLENVVIENNTGIRGAGVFIYGGSPTLTDVVIADNVLLTTNPSHQPLGGGLHILDAAVTLNNVQISGHLDAVQGGGLYASSLSTPPAVTMTGGEVSDNTADEYGAGVYIDSGTLDISDAVFSGNARSVSATYLAGGALYAHGTAVTVSGATIAQNLANSGAAALLDACPTVEMTGTLIIRNTGLQFGPNLYIETCGDAQLANLTLADNHGNTGRSGLFASDTPITVSNTISAFNTGGSGAANGIFIIGATPTLTCNNVFGNSGAAYGGVTDPTGTNGNIAADPLFCDRDADDYRIQVGSPCSPDESGACGLIGALDVCDSANSVADPAAPLAFRIEANFPNPFNPSTTIRFATPAAARTTVVVYDLKGRLIKQLLDADLPASAHAVQWHGDDHRGRSVATGVYFYRVTSGEHTAVGRMALIK